MPYETVRVKSVFLTCWRTPVLPDGPLLVHETKVAYEEVGEQILFVSYAPVDSPPPPDDLRKYMGEHVDEMLTYCTSLHIVIDGSGFMQSAKRMAMASIVLISGMRKRMFVHDSLDKIRLHATPAERDALSQAVLQAGERSLLTQRKLA